MHRPLPHWVTERSLLTRVPSSSLRESSHRSVAGCLPAARWAPSQAGDGPYSYKWWVEANGGNGPYLRDCPSPTVGRDDLTGRLAANATAPRRLLHLGLWQPHAHDANDDGQLRSNRAALDDPHRSITARDRQADMPQTSAAPNRTGHPRRRRAGFQHRCIAILREPALSRLFPVFPDTSSDRRVPYTTELRPWFREHGRHMPLSERPHFHAPGQTENSRPD